MPARRAVVRGQVQGVGFRQHARFLASRLGLSGEVWNRWDGAVETVFAHESQAVLDEFENALRVGPGRVDSVEAAPFEGEIEHVGFEIGPTRA